MSNRRKEFLSQGTIEAVGYVRMSTGKQADSPEQQREQIERYAAKHGMRIVRWYEDEGVSGTSRKGRDEFKRLLHDCETVRDFRAVIIWDQFRFSRMHPMDVSADWNVLRIAEVALHSVADGLIDFDSMGGYITASVKQFQGNGESRSKSQNVSRAQRSRSARGYWACGTPPIGYRAVPINGDEDATHKRKRLEVVPAQAALVKRIFAMYLEGVSSRRIAERLNREGILAPKIHSTPARPWCEQQISAVLTNLVYTGAVVYGKRLNAKYFTTDANGEPQPISIRNYGRRTRRDGETWTIAKDAHPAIIDEETFAKAAEIRESRRRECRRQSRSDYPLASLCVCGHCGRKAYRQTTRSRGREYLSMRCLTSLRGVSQKEECRYCLPGWPLVEEVVSRVLNEWLTDAQIEQGRKHVSKYLTDKRREAGETAEADASRLADVTARLKKAEAKVADIPDDMAATLYSKIRELRAEKAALEMAKAARSEFYASGETAVAERVAAIVAELKQCRDWIKSGEPEKVKAGLERIVEKVEIYTRPLTDKDRARLGKGNRVRLLDRIDIHFREICNCAGRESSRRFITPPSSAGFG